jgi:hypothetical protein
VLTIAVFTSAALADLVELAVADLIGKERAGENNAHGTTGRSGRPSQGPRERRQPRQRAHEGAAVHPRLARLRNGSGWRVTDLRVDWSGDPLAGLTALLGVWLPQRDSYIARALNPAAAPSYGVPGDE